MSGVVKPALLTLEVGGTLGYSTVEHLEQMAQLLEVLKLRRVDLRAVNGRNYYVYANRIVYHCAVEESRPTKTTIDKMREDAQ